MVLKIFFKISNLKNFTNKLAYFLKIFILIINFFTYFKSYFFIKKKIYKY